MAGGGGGDLARDTTQALLDQLLQAPAGAVAGEHGKVMQVQGGGAMGLCHLGVVNFAEPVVGGDGTGIGQDQTAHGIGDGGILLDPPVVDLQVVIHQILIVEQGGTHITHLLPLLAVEDVGLGHIGVAGFGQHLFHTVLDVFHGDAAVLDLRLKIRTDLQGQHIDHAGVIILIQRLKGLDHGRTDLGNLKFDGNAVSLQNLIHCAPPICKVDEKQIRTLSAEKPQRPYYSLLCQKCQATTPIYCVLFFR